MVLDNFVGNFYKAEDTEV